MIEAELQKLTAAIEALTRAVEENTRSAAARGIPTNSDNLRQEEKPAAKSKAKEPAKTPAETTVETPIEDKNPKSPEPANISANITEGDLKTLALEIARADSGARPTILAILAEHGAKTITQLDPKHYHAVHGRLLSLAYDIAKSGEPV